MITFQVHHYLKPETIETYKAATLANVRATLKEPGIVRFELYQDQDDPTHFSLLEIYQDEAAREAHLQTEHFLKWKEVYLGEPQIYARRGEGYNWTLVDALEPDMTLPKEAKVTLREITKETLRAVLDLKVTEYQNRFVAPNPVSIAEAHFEPKAWFRAIYADETPVGFVMMYIDPEEGEGVYYLWRYMMDARYQGKGFGYRALEQVIEMVKTTYPHAKTMKLSYVPLPGGPQPFYAKLGFVDTGVEHDGELEMELKLRPD
ncbi:MAG: hypothetical protein Fur0022_10370 [Anaerolineales bacterium]